MKQQKRKGFTLVELLVVIAILAILATVSVVGYMSFIKKANISNDMALVKQINDLLLADETIDGKPATMQEALDVIEENGFLIEKLTPTAQGHHFVYDISANRFALLNDQKEVIAPVGAKITSSSSAFAIIHKADELANWNGYSLYLAKDFSGTDTLDISAGLDVGECTTIKTINYSNSTAAKNTVICTNSARTTLTIYDTSEDGTISHYGALGQLNVDKCAMHSYYENGEVCYAKVTAGHVVANGLIKLMSSDATTASSVLVEGNIEQAYATSQENADALSQGANSIVWSFDSTFDAEYEAQKIIQNAITEEVSQELQDSNISVKYAARIGTTGYVTFEEAAAAAVANDEIVLMSNINFTVESIDSGEYLADACHVFDLDNITLNLSGYTITSYNFSVVYQGDNMTIKNGNFVCANGGSYALFVGDIRSTSNVVLQDISCVGGINVFNTKNVIIKEIKCAGASGTNYYAIWADENAEIIVEGGAFTSTGTAVLGTAVDTAEQKSCSSIVIKGGQFSTLAEETKLFLDSTYITVSGGTFNSDPTAYLAEGYQATESNGVWTVSAAN